MPSTTYWDLRLSKIYIHQVMHGKSLTTFRPLFVEYGMMQKTTTGDKPRCQVILIVASLTLVTNQNKIRLQLQFTEWWQANTFRWLLSGIPTLKTSIIWWRVCLEICIFSKTEPIVLLVSQLSLSKSIFTKDVYSRTKHLFRKLIFEKATRSAAK